MVSQEQAAFVLCLQPRGSPAAVIGSVDRWPPEAGCAPGCCVKWHRVDMDGHPSPQDTPEFPASVRKLGSRGGEDPGTMAGSLCGFCIGTCASAPKAISSGGVIYRTCSSIAVHRDRHTHSTCNPSVEYSSSTQLTAAWHLSSAHIQAFVICVQSHRRTGRSDVDHQQAAGHTALAELCALRAVLMGADSSVLRKRPTSRRSPAHSQQHRGCCQDLHWKESLSQLKIPSHTVQKSKVKSETKKQVPGSHLALEQ